MQRFIRPVLLWGAIVATIGATLIEWQSTLLEDFRPEISTLMILVATGALWLEYRVRRSGVCARMERSRLRLAVAWVMIVFTFAKGYHLIRDVRDELQILPMRNLWQKEQTERDIDVVEAWLTMKHT